MLRILAVLSAASLAAAAAIWGGGGTTASHASGVPTLSISNVGLTVTLSASGTGFDPYSGYQLAFTYDPSLVSWGSAAYVADGIYVCEDSGGLDNIAMIACSSLLGPITATGPLASITLNPTGTPGCLDVTVIPYDGSNDYSTVFTADVDFNLSVNPLGTSELQIPVSGGTCAVATDTPTATPTDTPTATPTDTPTDTPTPTNTPSPTATAAVTGTATVLSVGGIAEAPLLSEVASGRSGGSRRHVLEAALLGFGSMLGLCATGVWIKRRWAR